MAEVNVQISKELVQPIVEQHINSAILAAMGGGDALIAKAVERILEQKVNSEGKVANYSSENKYTYIEYLLNGMITNAVKKILNTHMEKASDKIVEQLIKQLQTQSKAKEIANCLLDAFLETTKNQYRSEIKVEMKALNNY